MVSLKTIVVFPKYKSGHKRMFNKMILKIMMRKNQMGRNSHQLNCKRINKLRLQNKLKHNLKLPRHKVSLQRI